MSSAYQPQFEQPSRAEWTERIVRQGMIPRWVLDWCDEHAGQPGTEGLRQAAHGLLADLAPLAEGWTAGRLSAADLAAELPGFERRRSRLKDHWQRLQPAA